MSAPVDFVAHPVNNTVTELRPLSARARTYLVKRRSFKFSRAGLKGMVRDGWTIVTWDEWVKQS